jgi:hypothetical protein
VSNIAAMSGEAFRGRMMRWRRSMSAAACAALLGAVAGPAMAETGRLYDPGDFVAGHPGMDYLALVQLALPTIVLSPDTHMMQGQLPTPVPRHIAGDTYEGQPPDPVTLGAIEDKRIRIGGKPRIALLVDLGPDPDRVQGTALLILMTDEPTPKVLDMADVAIDKDTVFADQAVLKLGAGDDALVTWSEHDDADLTMGGYVLISTVGDHLSLIDTIRLQSERLCAWSNIETVHFSSTPDPAKPYARITASIHAAFKRTPEACGENGVPKVRPQTFNATYQWNPQSRAFETKSDALRRLGAFNDIVFNP